MNYSSGVLGLASVSAGQLLPDHGWLWLAARVLLDTAGGLFLLYLATLWTLTLAVLGTPGRTRRLAAQWEEE